MEGVKSTSRENKIGADSSPVQAGQTAKMQKIGIVAGIALIAFLLGFVPMWLTARTYENERDALQTQMRPSVLQNNLATAAIYARRGEFEQARQQTSDFYTSLRAEFDQDGSAFASSTQREAIQQILAQRDETITLLARNDSGAADRLSDVYFAYASTKNSGVQKDQPQ